MDSLPLCAAVIFLYLSIVLVGGYCRVGSPPELWYRGVECSKLTAGVDSRVTDLKMPHM